MDNRKYVNLLAPGVDEEELAKKADLIDGKVPASELPSYVDDVVEYASLADFPAEGEGSKIYVALDTGFTYRWSGSDYTQIGGQDLSDYYTKTEADALLAGKQAVGDYATNAALEAGLATKQAVGDYATNTALADGLATKQNVGDYATNSALQAGLATKQNVGDYATNTALTEGLATKQAVGDYATRAELAALPDLEIVTYQDQTPLTEAQLAKAVDGKLAIYCNGRLYTKYYEGTSIINFHAFDIGHNIGSSVNVSDTMRSQEYVILLYRDTRMLSNTGAMPVSSIGDYAANFLDAATAPAVDGKKLIREANLALYATSSALTSGLAAKQDTLVSGTNIKTLNGNSLLGSGNIDLASSPMVEITWAELKALRDAGELVPGMQYRITDYQCTTTQGNTSSANRQFDIIVIADRANMLSRHARATWHEGDTYFDENQLEQWRLWYCLDNDQNRFSWADTTNGKGVIYRMIDEFNNDVPYDFKNIKFNQKFTFDRAGNDLSKGQIWRGSSGTVQIVCYNNIIKPYYTNATFGHNTIQNLNNTVIKSDTTYSVNATIANNVFGINNHDNVIGVNSSSVDATSWTGNKIGNYFNNNTIISGSSNIIGPSCSYNTIGRSFSANIIDWSMSSNTIGDDFYNNKVGRGFSSNTVSNNFRYNTIGLDFNWSTIGELVQYNTFLGLNAHVTVPSYTNYCILDPYVCYLILTGSEPISSSNRIQNVHLHLGVHGAGYNNEITVTPPTNLAYETDVYQDESGNIIYKKNNDADNSILAPVYDATSTYAVGDAVTYNNQLYQCIIAIETAEAWTAAHWQSATVADLIAGSIGNAINRGY